MQYCPYCSTPITKKTDLCPECKKNLDIDLLGSVYSNSESSHINTSAKRALWFKEHSRYIWPFITLLIGLAVGAVTLYSFAQLQFAGERSEYQERIAQLETQVNDSQQSAGNAEKGFIEQLEKKDEIITILAEQKKIIGQVISFTRRLANNSTITPNSPGDGDYYSRNVRYLIRQYETQHELLSNSEKENIQNVDLRSIPQFLE